MSYSGVGLLSLIVHFIVNYEAVIKAKNTASAPARSRYRLFLISAMIYYVVDATWGIAYETRILPFVFAFTTLYFLATSLTVILWMRFIITYLNRKSVLNNLLKYAAGSIFIFQVLTLILNPFVPVFFSFDIETEYLPGPCRFISLGMQTILFSAIALYTLAVALRKGISEKDKLHYLATAFSGLVMTVFIVLQNVFPMMPYYAIGLLLAGCVIHTFVIADEKWDWHRELGSVKEMAYRDPLTNVKNKTAFMDRKSDMDAAISEGSAGEFGIVVFDLNDLKKVNDSRGHDAGDKYIMDACHLICNVFKHSPIYRIGGDEFVALLEGDDYADREELVKLFEEEIDKNVLSGGVVVSEGLDIFASGSDDDLDSVFARADRKMYDRKKVLKSRK
ncbi:MAG: diguanylate cyclase [Lachnospiraceae bacterium]|nr:diguanylate cyclase [Lachnospiraceae bacterium]MBP5472026.1 diguanylate cyclase [Lachnospiraceae bacterium]